MIRRESGLQGRRVAVACVAMVLAVAAVLSLLIGVRPVEAAGPFSQFFGTWRGTAEVRLASGQTERLRCNAYYTAKDGGAGLGLAIRCASPSNKIELRAQLANEGGAVSGHWEERTYNAAGNVTGQVAGGRLRLSIIGGGFRGSMAVSIAGGNQSVSIRTEGISLRSVSINLSRA